MSKKSILWVEDEIGTIKGTVRSARRHNFEVKIAESTEEATKNLQDDKFDILIVDFRVPKIKGEPPIKGEGVDFIKKVLAQCRNKENLQKKILLLTAQLASYKKEMILDSEINFEVMEKPGSHLRVIDWIKRIGEAVE